MQESGFSSAFADLQYQVPITELNFRQLQVLLERDGIVNISRYETIEALRQLARDRGRDTARLRGMAALETKAGEFVVLLSRLEKTKQFAADEPLGLTLKRIGNWALVFRAPPRLGIRVGDVIAAVDGRRMLLEQYETMFDAIRRAKNAHRSFELTFRRAPFHRGWLLKLSRNRNGGRFSGLTGWKKRYFVCGYGLLAYFDNDPARGGKQKGSFPLSNSDADGLITTLKTQKTKSGHVCLVLEHGNDKLVLRSKLNDIHNWAALFYIAIAHMNGGNDLIYRNERKTIAFNRDLARRRIPVTATPLGVTHQPMNLYQTNSATQQPQPPIATRQEEENLAAPPLPPIVLSIDPSQSSLQSSQSTVMEETATFYGTLPVPAVTVDPQDDPALDEMSRQASVRLEQNSVDGRKLDLHV